MVSSMVPITIGRHVVVDANHDHHRQHQHQHHRDRHADIDVDDDRWLLAIRGSRVVVAGGITSRYAFPSNAPADDLSSLLFCSLRRRGPSKNQQLLLRGLSQFGRALVGPLFVRASFALIQTE